MKISISLLNWNFFSKHFHNSTIKLPYDTKKISFIQSFELAVFQASFPNKISVGTFITERLLLKINWNCKCFSISLFSKYLKRKPLLLPVMFLVRTGVFQVWFRTSIRLYLDMYLHLGLLVLKLNLNFQLKISNLINNKI